ncbi:MAG: SAM-dependent methyltransferase [Chloroflexota bacterium]|nr:SAM-dependent methyltransferase [Dehalococcoidia bacterium]MDW8045893.1 SAM-dependent methyltransferase [Chloroflexota bacterium]
MPLDLDPGLAALGNPQLVRAIIAEMAGGAISFQRFMELALYHPEHGYYQKPGRIGRQGDFLTSPVIHPLFGWAVAAWCHWVWEQAGRPIPFVIFEPGAGEGHLARAVLDWAEGRHPAFAEAIRYVAIERGARGSDPRVTWITEPTEPAEAGVVVANEFFDALPVQLFEVTERGPAEVMVAWDGERFVELLGRIATIDGAPPAGRFEVSPQAFGTMRAMARFVRRGAVLVFDYGYPREELWAPWRTQGTLLCFYRHTAHADPYIHVGEQDLTAHVDLDALLAGLEAEEMEPWGPRTQREFLYALGAHDLVEAVRHDLQEYFVRRRALEQLTDSAGLGRIRVIAGLRGISGPPPGFEEEP